MPEWIPASCVPGLFQAPTATRVSGMSIASLVLGLLWLYGIGAILAIVFGAVALNQIRLSDGRLIGRGMAIAGLVLGIVGVALPLLVIAIAADQAG